MNRLLEDPLLRRLADADPAPAAPLTAAEEARADALLDRLTMTPAATTARVRPRRRGRGRLAAAATALVAVVGAGLFATAPASAEHVLLEAATGAAAQPVRTGDYWYVRSLTQDPQSLPYEQESWQSRDAALVRSGAGEAFAAWEAGQDAPAEPFRGREVTEPAVEGGGPPPFGDAVQLTWDEVRELPADPDALARELDARTPASGRGHDQDRWSAVVGLLLGSPASPTQRRALWEVLARVPGVDLLGTTTDAAGREGTAVEADFTDQGWYRVVLVLDPVDGRLLETRHLEPDGTPAFRTTLLEQGYRDQAPEPATPH